MDVKKIVDLMSKLTPTKFTSETYFQNNLKFVQALDPFFGDIGENPNQSARLSFVRKATDLLLQLKNCLLEQSDDTCDVILSVAQCKTVAHCLNFVLTFSFVPCILPSVWEPLNYRKMRTIQLAEDFTSNKDYEELKYNVNLFFDLLKEPTFKRLIMMRHGNVLLAGLSQLSLIPILKPRSEHALKYGIDETRYEQFFETQKKFKIILTKLLLIDRDPLVIREIIFMMGRMKLEKNVKAGLGHLFSTLLLQTNGIRTVLRVVSDLAAESSKPFNQSGLEEWSNLIHNFYQKSRLNYVNLIIPQVWELLRSDEMLHGTHYRSIAVYCISILHKENYNDFLIYYMNPIEQSLKKKALQNDKYSTVSECIDKLHSLFYVFKNELWSLNPKLLISFASSIYPLYIATSDGIYYLKSKLEDLVFLMLFHFSDSKDHLKLIIFPKYQVNVMYGDTGDILRLKYEILDQLQLELDVDIVLDLIDKRMSLKAMKVMFLTFLDLFMDATLNEFSCMEKYFIIKAINHLIQKDDVQKSLSSEPDIVLTLIASVLKTFLEDNVTDTDLLSLVLMILRCIMENIKKMGVEQYHSLEDILLKTSEKLNVEMKNMVLETLQELRKTQNSNLRPSTDFKCTIDEILLILRDPLLVIRSHGLVELKKMIEYGDSTVFEKKSTILIMIQENLKNTDSYLYLSAIFALSALCTKYPEDILPILCEQYSMPKFYNHSPETRLKIGEVLMKTVKSLKTHNIPTYKNYLLNTFLSGARDSDILVRASSLSNLGDVCHILRYNIHTVIGEIMKCVKYTLRFDKAPEPRRAAILLLKMILDGAGTELLDILEGNITDIYHILKQQYERTEDDATRLHAQASLEKLTDIMKSLMHPPEILIKKILSEKFDPNKYM